MPKEFSIIDGLLPKDLVRYGLDHISGGFTLFNHPSHFDSAGYLVHIGYECLLKGWILHLSGKFEGIHDIKLLVKQIPDFALENLPQNYIKTINLINEYQYLRYPNRKEPKEVGTEEMELISRLIEFTLDLLPNELCINDAEDLVSKGGRVLMKKKIDT